MHQDTLKREAALPLAARAIYLGKWTARGAVFATGMALAGTRALTRGLPMKASNVTYRPLAPRRSGKCYQSAVGAWSISRGIAPTDQLPQASDTSPIQGSSVHVAAEWLGLVKKPQLWGMYHE